MPEGRPDAGNDPGSNAPNVKSPGIPTRAHASSGAALPMHSPDKPPSPEKAGDRSMAPGPAGPAHRWHGSQVID